MRFPRAVPIDGIYSARLRGLQRAARSFFGPVLNDIDQLGLAVLDIAVLGAIVSCICRQEPRGEVLHVLGAPPTKTQ